MRACDNLIDLWRRVPHCTHTYTHTHTHTHTHKNTTHLGIGIIELNAERTSDIIDFGKSRAINVSNKEQRSPPIKKKMTLQKSNKKRTRKGKKVPSVHPYLPKERN
jgi:hypothetical protein